MGYNEELETMKKAILLVLLVTLAFAKASMGQKMKMGMGSFNVRYEYHPCHFDLFADKNGTDSGNVESMFNNMHVFKLGYMAGILLGDNFSFELRPVSLVVSVNKDERYWGFSGFNMVFRKDMGRLNPCFCLDPCEVIFINFKENKGAYRCSISGGVEYYLTNRSIFCANIGVMCHLQSPVETSCYWSPFIGIGYKADILDSIGYH